MVAVMAMWFLSWASGVLSRAAHETGKKIEFVPPNDR
jgi:hypothetical protein